MASVQLKLLGGFAASLSSGRPVELAGKKNRALLAYLAVNRGKRLSREKLMQLLWSDRGEAQARGSVRQALAAVKGALAEIAPAALVLEGDSVTLDRAVLTTDVAEFETLAGSSSVDDLHRAAGLYEGDLLEGLAVRDPAFEDWLSAERARLRECAIGVLGRLTAQLTAAEAVAMGKRLLALDPLREASHRALMLAYAAAGEKALALQQYAAVRDLLKTDLDVKPARETEELRLRILEAEAGPAAAAVPVESGSSAPKAISIAVLPFANISGDAGQDYFADGLTEDLITELSSYRHLSVAARPTVFAYKGRSIKVQDIARDLGADFFVEGGVRQAGNRIRITVQLVDAETGTHVWAERLDREIDDIFAVQDEVVTAIVARLAYDLDQVAGEQRRRKPTTNIDAFGHFLQAKAAWRKGAEQVARDHLLEAVKIDPNYGQALAFSAFCLSYGRFSFTSGLSEHEAARRAREFAQRAIAADKTDPFTLHRIAMASLLLGEPGRARHYIEAAATQRPRDVEIMGVRGLVLAYCGQHKEGIARMEDMWRLEPRLPPGYRLALADALYLARDYKGALTTVELMVDPPYYVRLISAACLAQLGRSDEAGRIIADAPKVYDLQQFARNCAAMCALSKDAEHLLEGFRKAGIEV